jgi:hypothetical protein
MTVELPLTLVSNVKRRLANAAVVTASPMSGSQQVQSWGGIWWEFEIEFTMHTAAEGRMMSAFWSKIGGRLGTFLFRDPSIQQMSLGTPLVNGASQTGKSLLTKGWTANKTVLKAGDFIQLGAVGTTRLHHVTADAVSGATGLATLSIEPALRYSPANSAALVVDAPAALLRLNDDPWTAITQAARHSFSVTAREAL